MVKPARRFVLAQSWWIASELVRRHPHLTIIETRPDMTGQDNLTLVDPTTSPTSRASVVELDRNGHLRATTASEFTQIPWSRVMAADNAHDVVRSLEAAAGLAPPDSAPVTGRKVVTFRILARLLTSLVDDRHEWSISNGYLQTFQIGSGCWPKLREFPRIGPLLDAKRPEDIDGQPAFRFWLLERHGALLAVLDSDGRLHLRDRPPTELLPVYRRTGSLTATIGETLGRLLP